MWSFLGMGFVQSAVDDKLDRSPYINVDVVDKEWIGGPSPHALNGKPHGVNPNSSANENRKSRVPEECDIGL
jgi:hypothetical protein